MFTNSRKLEKHINLVENLKTLILRILETGIELKVIIEIQMTRVYHQVTVDHQEGNGKDRQPLSVSPRHSIARGRGRPQPRGHANPSWDPNKPHSHPNNLNNNNNLSQNASQMTNEFHWNETDQSRNNTTRRESSLLWQSRNWRWNIAPQSGQEGYYGNQSEVGRHGHQVNVTTKGTMWGEKPRQGTALMEMVMLVEDPRRKIRVASIPTSTLITDHHSRHLRPCFSSRWIKMMLSMEMKIRRVILLVRNSVIRKCSFLWWIGQFKIIAKIDIFKCNFIRK